MQGHIGHMIFNSELTGLYNHAKINITAWLKINVSGMIYISTETSDDDTRLVILPQILSFSNIYSFIPITLFLTFSLPYMTEISVVIRQWT